MKPDRLVLVPVTAALGPCQRDVSLVSMHSSPCCFCPIVVSAIADVGLPKDLIFKGLQLMCVCSPS